MMDERIKKLKELRDKIFNLANSYSGEETGHIACQLHESVNYINRALRGIEGDPSIDAEPQMILRSLGWVR